MRKILERCPTCGGDLAIAELQCRRCETVVRSRYSPCPFCRLTDDQITFLLLFVENRGNLTELEKNLGVSYPTVRNKLDEIIQVVRGSQAAPSAAAVDTERRRRTTETEETAASPSADQRSAPSREVTLKRRAILEHIAAGQLDPVEALEQLRRLGDDNG